MAHPVCDALTAEKKRTEQIAIYHLSAKIVKRSTGRSSVAAAAYRSGSELFDDRTGKTHDYTKKFDVVHSEIMAPAGAPDWVYDRQKLWNAVEKSETRKDAQTAREIEIALPIELTPVQRSDLVREFVTSEFIAKGMVADIAIHVPHKVDKQENPHAHILLTTRELDGQKFAAKKNRDWNSKELLETWRERWAEVSNAHLKKNGHEVTIDHRSLDDQNLVAIARGDEKTAHRTAREPGVKMGHNAMAMERRGIKTDRGDRNRRIGSRNFRRFVRRPKPLADMLIDHITGWAQLDAYGMADPGIAIIMKLQRQQIEFMANLLIDRPTQIAAAGVKLLSRLAAKAKPGPEIRPQTFRERIEQYPRTMNAAPKRVPMDLHVPFMEKDAALAAGAKWDRERKQWYAQDKNKLGDLAKWATPAPSMPAPPPARETPAATKESMLIESVLQAEKEAAVASRHPETVKQFREAEAALPSMGPAVETFLIGQYTRLLNMNKGHLNKAEKKMIDEHRSNLWKAAEAYRSITGKLRPHERGRGRGPGLGM